MSGSVAKIKYTDEELELEFENALKEVLEQNRLMLRSVSEGVSSFLFKITFLIALAMVLSMLTFSAAVSADEGGSDCTVHGDSPGKRKDD